MIKLCGWPIGDLGRFQGSKHIHTHTTHTGKTEDRSMGGAKLPLINIPPGTRHLAKGLEFPPVIGNLEAATVFEKN